VIVRPGVREERERERERDRGGESASERRSRIEHHRWNKVAPGGGGGKAGALKESRRSVKSGSCTYAKSVMHIRTHAYT
jgi:hypothetical protein